MEVEALRKQLSEEIASQFDAKLREAKRQKSLIEEEFELSSEKWRTERRRLNSEIDRLEASLAEARQSGRDSSESRVDPDVDPQEIARVQSAAEETIREASQAWEKERARLQAEISRLQESIAGLIERTNNPLRSNPTDRSKLESKYDDALRAKRQVEEALIKAKAEWEAEKLTLLETTRQRPGPALPVRKVDDQLDKKLQESTRLKESLALDLEKARQELSRLKEAHAAELQNMSARLLAAKTEWEAEKVTLANEVTKLRQTPVPDSTPRKSDDQLEKRLQEAVRLRDALAVDLEKARQELTKLREAHATDQQNMNARLLAARTQWEAEKVALTGEVTKLRQVPAASTSPRKLDEQLDKKLQEAVRLHDGLSADLEKARHEIAKLKSTHSAELQDFTSRYIQTRTDLERQLKESEDARARLERDMGKETPPSEELVRLQSELETATREKTELTSRLAASADSVGADVVQGLQQQFDARIQEMMQENSRLSEKLNAASSRLAADSGQVATSTEAGSNGNPVATLDAAAIDDELRRVEALTAEIAKLIDDPDTELATVIRKNVERAALDSYIKGILFSLGRGKKL